MNKRSLRADILKQTALSKIANDIAKCRICQEDSKGLPVPGEGNPNAKVVFIGEAPGGKEAQTGRPFVGPSGKFLRSLIKDIGLGEKEVYITSPVKYQPKKGTPSEEQIAHGKVHFDKQIEIINPKVLVLMGAVASLATLGEKVPIQKMHGQVIQRGGRVYFISYHPAAALRFTPLRIEIKKDFEKLKSLLTD